MRSRPISRHLVRLAGLLAIGLASQPAGADGPQGMIPEAVRQCTPVDRQDAQSDAGAAQGPMTIVAPEGGVSNGLERLTGMLPGAAASAPPAFSRPADDGPAPSTLPAERP